jgi:hypothetical protein
MNEAGSGANADYQNGTPLEPLHAVAESSFYDLVG